jgi:hypothetical protein
MLPTSKPVHGNDEAVLKVLKEYLSAKARIEKANLKLKEKKALLQASVISGKISNNVFSDRILKALDKNTKDTKKDKEKIDQCLGLFEVWDRGESVIAAKLAGFDL